MWEAFGLLNAFFCFVYLSMGLVYRLIKTVYDNGADTGPGPLRKGVF